MKHYKKLNTQTREGITFTNVQLFPSMEWGDEGGQSADIIYKGKNIGTYYQAGNGGMADVRLTCDKDTEQAFKSDLNSAIDRLDKTKEQYKNIKFTLDDDVETLFCILLDLHEDSLSFKKKEKNFKTAIELNKYNLGFAIVDYGFQIRTLSALFTNKEIFENGVKEKLKKENKENYIKISFFYSMKDFATL